MKGLNECQICHECFDDEFHLQEHLKVYGDTWVTQEQNHRKEQWDIQNGMVE